MLTIAWLARTRIPCDWQNGVDAPFGESVERYRVDVMSGALVKRELVIDDARQVIYAVALQTADFGGPVTTSLKVRVSQYSEIVGWGWPSEITVSIACVIGQAVFARFNAADKSSGVTLSNADLTASTAAAAINGARTTTSKAASRLGKSSRGSSPNRVSRSSLKRGSGSSVSKETVAPEKRNVAFATTSPMRCDASRIIEVKIRAGTGELLTRSIARPVRGEPFKRSRKSADLLRLCWLHRAEIR